MGLLTARVTRPSGKLLLLLNEMATVARVLSLNAAHPDIALSRSSITKTVEKKILRKSNGDKSNGDMTVQLTVAVEKHTLIPKLDQVRGVDQWVGQRRVVMPQICPDEWYSTKRHQPDTNASSIRALNLCMS
jgi:hypothetical protein